MDYRHKYTKVGVFNHLLEVHNQKMLFRFRARTRRGVYKKAHRYMK